MNLPKKRYAQYWLKDLSILDQIVQAAEIQPTETVLEIGPGTGNLTERLLHYAQGVEAIEIDRTLEKTLTQRFAQRPVQVHFGDVLTMPLPQNCSVVVANIPYYITGPILNLLLGSPRQPLGRFRKIVLLVQKEIGERLSAVAGNGDYGALTVVVQYLAHVDLIAHVPPSAFQPRPKVDSAIVALTPRPLDPQAQDPALLERLVKQGFSTRRKMLKNTLKSWRDPGQTEALLLGLKERADSRAEALSVIQWVNFANQWLQLPES